MSAANKLKLAILPLLSSDQVTVLAASDDEIRVLVWALADSSLRARAAQEAGRG